MQTAKINLGYARVTAPISGRIGRALVTEGALVGQGEATQLAVIQQINPMYVNFTQSATEVLQLRRAMEAASSSAPAAPTRPACASCSKTAANTRSPASCCSPTSRSIRPSGQVTLRAEVPNPKGVLLPGLYVRVRLEQAAGRQRASRCRSRRSRARSRATRVMVVGADGKVAPRTVKIGAAQDNHWVVLEGLKAGEQVMVDGFQKLR